MILLLFFFSLNLNTFALETNSPRANCFETIKLSEPLRSEAEAVISLSLRGEGLYTLLGDYKPMTSFYNQKLSQAQSSKGKSDEINKILKIFNCEGIFKSFYYEYHQNFEGQKYGAAFIVNLNSFKKLMLQELDFFSSFENILNDNGDFDPEKIVTAIDGATFERRYHGFGLLFGYPKSAIGFFINAEKQRLSNGVFVDRDFLSLPTIDSKNSRYVWAIPKGHQRNQEEIELMSQAQLVIDQLIYIEKELSQKAPSEVLKDLLDVREKEDKFYLKSKINIYCLKYLN